MRDAAFDDTRNGFATCGDIIRAFKALPRACDFVDMGKLSGGVIDIIDRLAIHDGTDTFQVSVIDAMWDLIR